MNEPELEVTDRGGEATDPQLIERAVQATLQHCDRQDLPVSLLLTDDAEISRIHGEFLDDPTPTDVISFPMDDSAELVVSTETARRVAAEHGHDWQAEVALYIVHGLLHCCGFDDIEEGDRQQMRIAERAVLGQLGLEVAAVDRPD